MSDLRPTSSPPPSPRWRANRWVRRAPLILLVFILLLLGGTQILLWTDLPRRVVIAQLQRQLGMIVTVESVSTGWFGRSTLRNVTASLPLANEPLLTVPLVQASHTSLLPMILGETLRLRRLELQNPALNIRQSDSGRWNVLEAGELINRAGKASGPAPQRTIMPIVEIEAATVKIVDNRDNESLITPVNASGSPVGALLFRYKAQSGDRITLSGEVVPGGLWQHDLVMSLREVDEWARPFIAGWQDHTSINARWRGQLSTAGELRGRLEIQSLAAGDYAASGVTNIAIAGPQIWIRPQSLHVKTGQPVAPEFLVSSGLVFADSQAVRLEGVRLSMGGGAAEINGAWNRHQDSGDIRAQWSDVRLATVAQSGQFEGSFQTVFPGRPKVNATLVSSGTLETGGSWSAELGIAGQGESLRDMTWTADFPRATYDGRMQVKLDGLKVEARATDELLRLTQITLPARGQVAGQGELNFQTQNWWLWISGGDFSMRRAPDAPVSFDANASGNFGYVQIDKLYLNAGDVELSMFGTYHEVRPSPLDLRIWLTHLPLGDDQSPLVRGRLRGELAVAGTVHPLKLAVTGSMHGRDLHLQSRPVGDITADVSGIATANYVSIDTQKLKLLGGNWNISGTWPADHPRRPFRLEIDAEDLPLAQVGEALGNPSLKGMARASLELDIQKLALDKMRGTGSFAVENASAKALKAQSITGTISLRDGRLAIEPLELREAGGTTLAKAHADVANLGAWTVEATTRDWPLMLRDQNTSLALDGQANMVVDLRENTLRGNAQLDGLFARDAEQIGVATLSVTAEGRTIHARKFDASFLGGSLSGNGVFHADRPSESEAQLQMHDLDASIAGTWIPSLKDLRGSWTGQLVLTPDHDPRALGPLRIDLGLQAADGGFRTTSLTGLQIRAFADVSKRFQEFRIVSDSATAQVADGSVGFFARLTRSPQTPLWMQTSVEFENLNLDQLVHSAAPDAEPMPGRLRGKINLTGDPRQPQSVFGDASLELTESDLANFDPIAFLYNAMSLGGSGKGPVGYGNVQARLESSNLEIPGFYLFNRGVEVRGVGSVRNILDVPDSPVAGTLVGTARPLADLKLPLMADVDSILGVLQSNATTVQISGTLRAPQTRRTTLDDVSDALQAMLVGDVKREKQGK